MPLAYAYRYSDAHRAGVGRHQSEQHMWSYKEQRPGPGCVTDLSAMLLLALQWHRRCAESKVGLPWQLWAVVPSSKHQRLGTHPLVGLGLGAGLDGTIPPLPSQRAELVLTGPPSADRDLHEGRFFVPQPGLIAGKHVLLLEDTWVTGSSAQAAALSLKQAGAAGVTIACVARWLREDTEWVDCSAFFRELQTPYDALDCPVLGHHCSGPYG